MTIWHAILLGIVQGLTEFLPISSSAHLILVPWLAGWPEPGLEFDVALHLGTLLAVLIYFWRDLIRMALAFLVGIKIRKPFIDQNSRLAWIILLGSIPAAIVGYTFNDAIDSYFHQGSGGNRSIVLIAVLLILLGLLTLYGGANCAPRSTHGGLALERWRDNRFRSGSRSIAGSVTFRQYYHSRADDRPQT